MQTIYATTTHFVQHQGNVVDLGEYRRKLAQLQEDLFPVYQEEVPEEEPVLRLVPADRQEDARPRRRHSRRARVGWFFDICASLSVVAMTTAFTLTVILT